MTLFSNILQNPLDPHAKSDTRLMDLVVTFLSMLGQEAEQGGVHRMLAICSEFCRISKVVIERAEKEQSSRRKRKPMDAAAAAAKTNNNASTRPTFHLDHASSSSVSDAPGSGGTATRTPTRNFSVSSTSRDSGSALPSPASTSSFGHIPATAASLGGHSPSAASSTRRQQQDRQPVRNGDYDPCGNEMNAFGALGVSPPAVPLIARPFTQPLLPQDLFGLPATLDWSWSEMTGGAYPSVENGNYGSSTMQ
ncbi:hypothetical protein E4U53_004742 [Claviceps sorghi]|nr:hypothetical protein E4U53_004742 [Claviceps sorghi]